MYVPTRGIRPQLEIIARAPLPTHQGTFDMRVFRWGQPAVVSGAPSSLRPPPDLSPDHVALTLGDPQDAEDLLVRVHSECITGEVFNSLKCDCRQQLEAAQTAIAEEGRGVLIYLRQEGRGIGLANKVRAYELQARGHDTVDANRLLGLPDDARDYSAAAAMLAELGVRSIRLMTNNPKKESALRDLGVEVIGREAVVVSTNPWSANYLETKRLRMGHHLPALLAAAMGDAE